MMVDDTLPSLVYTQSLNSQVGGCGGFFSYFFYSYITSYEAVGADNTAAHSVYCIIVRGLNTQRVYRTIMKFDWSIQYAHS